MNLSDFFQSLARLRAAGGSTRTQQVRGHSRRSSQGVSILVRRYRRCRARRLSSQAQPRPSD
jgi:hypothetical protein